MYSGEGPQPNGLGKTMVQAQYHPKDFAGCKDCRPGEILCAFYDFEH